VEFLDLKIECGNAKQIISDHKLTLDNLSFQGVAHPVGLSKDLTTEHTEITEKNL
jgi:hypothetical protein